MSASILAWLHFFAIFCTTSALHNTSIATDPMLPEPRSLNTDTVVLTCPIITDWGRWGKWVQCTYSYVTGFQLKVERRKVGIDNTGVNGITISCGIPEQNEIDRISSASGPWGTSRTRLFCENGPAIGFQLKVQTIQGKDIDDAATVNVRMLCDDGQILEGYEEKNEYKGSLWSEPRICPDGMAVCGMQTQVEPRKWNRDDTALNNIRIKCCKLDDDPHEQMIRTNPKLNFNLTYFKGQNGTGRSETFYLKYGKCYNIPLRWRREVGSIYKTTPCIKLWQRKDCNGASRCFCDDNLLKLDKTFTMTRNMLWYQHFTAVGPCNYLKEQHDDNGYVTALLFSENEEKTKLVLAPGECLTYYEGDKWSRKIVKVVLSEGCLDLYNDEECTGARLRVNREVFEVGNEWKNKIMSVKNCLDHKL